MKNPLVTHYCIPGLALLVILLTTNCGYTLKHRLKDSTGLEQGIFVPVLENKTDEVGMERVFTNALIRELTSRRELVLTERDNADIELTGSLLKIDYSPTAFSATGFQGLTTYRRIPSEYGVRVTLALTLFDRRKKKTIWNRDFSAFRRVNGVTTRTFDYQAPSSVGLITQSVIESLYQDIARDIMRDIYDEMVEGV